VNLVEWEISIPSVQGVIGSALIVVALALLRGIPFSTL